MTLKICPFSRSWINALQGSFLCEYHAVDKFVLLKNRIAVFLFWLINPYSFLHWGFRDRRWTGCTLRVYARKVNTASSTRLPEQGETRRKSCERDDFTVHHGSPSGFVNPSQVLCPSICLSVCAWLCRWNPPPTRLQIQLNPLFLAG